MIQFTVYGEPVAQARARAAIVAGHVHMYDPKKSKDFKQQVYGVALEHRPPQVIEGAVRMEVQIFRGIPKSFSKKKAAAAEACEIRPTTKPDVDNYIKAIKDALKSVVWKDDSQVCTLIVGKFYSHTPRVEIKINELKG